MSRYSNIPANPSSIMNQLSDEDKSYIWENYQSQTETQISRHLHKHNKTIYDFFYENDLETPGDLLRKKPKKNSVPEGMFDIHERSDWMIGK